ncbi:MAG: hypothetical protein FWC84_08115, partial [Alphaproteobacteria bacterium]|nr:hypothetical protein [Alphaproteobacteria bacterium]
DFLSTVSGGGYIGNSLTTTLQKTKGEFPFSNKENYDDTDSVYHIRDYSNYLIPHGALDVVTAIGVIGRGLVANAIIILPVLLFFVWITLVLHPDVASLGLPLPIYGGLVEFLGKLLPIFQGPDETHSWLAALPGYWITVILLGANLLFLIVWAVAASLGVGQSASLSGGWVGFSKFLFIITLTAFFVETQPLILWAINKIDPSAPDPIRAAHASLHSLWERMTAKDVESYSMIAGALAAIFAFFSKYLGDIVALASRATTWKAWFQRISATAALWLAGLLVPFLLWFSYLWLVDNALDKDFARLGYFGALVISTFLALFINPNRTSLYRLYRDRLSKAFLFDPSGHPPKRDIHGDLPAFEPKMYEIDTNLCPYPIVNAALNIEASQFANRRGRNADFFMFTPEYIGSGATGYIGTRNTKEPALDIGTAMAISGAALSANMGSSTIKALTFTLAVLNIRLGYWLRNPNPDFDSPPPSEWRDWLWAKVFVFPSLVLFAEMFGWITERRSKIYLTDGGHIENLGIYSLLKRRCKVILAVDAEADPTMSFGSLLILERYARIDLGAAIDLPWEAIRNRTLAVNQAFAKAERDAIPAFDKSFPHCAAGEIRYGPDETGLLLYIKASLTGDEDDYILDYKRRNPEFPHETTSDQFFGEEQLEAYRALGFHIANGLLTGETPFAVNPRANETEGEARARILNLAREAFLGSDAKVAGARRKTAAPAPVF